MPSLTASKGNRAVFTTHWTKESFRIGRSSENDLTLPDENISRHHAVIQHRGGIHYLIDKNANGIAVNGSTSEGRWLKDGKVLHMGPWQLLFKSSGAEDEALRKEAATAITRIESLGDQTKILKLNPSTQKWAVRRPVLRIRAADGTAQTRNISRTPFTIGSQTGCHAVIADDYVSSRHCEIVRKDDEYWVRDLGSTNGTLMRGLKVKEAPLEPRVEFSVGQARIIFDTVEEDEALIPLAVDQFCGMVGRSSAMQELYAKVERVAPTELTVLIQAETGSGKELLSRALHDLSPRRGGSYIIINCGAISLNLIESELFGHEKGAFTGALNRHTGAFEQAHGGTVVLDEIGELPLELQPKLLRVLENRTLRRVGGRADIRVDVRVVAATHRDLRKMVKEGRFREDLYFRLNGIPLWIPPLRERVQDIPLLVRYFLEQSSPQGVPKISPLALEKMAQHSWHGNIRELKNVLLRSLIFSLGGQISSDDIDITPDYGADAPPDAPPPSLKLAEVEKGTIEEALLKTQGNKTQAAVLLGIAKSTLFKKMKDYGIPY